MAEIVVDESRAPIIVVTFPSEGSVEDYARVIERYREVAQRGARVGWLIDMRAFNPLTSPAATRKASAALIAPHIPFLQTVSAGEARVVTSNLVRGVSTAFTWLTGAPWPTTHFKTMDDAETWLRVQLAKPQH